MTELKKSVKTRELFDCDIDFLTDIFASAEYPWEILPKIKDIIEEILSRGLSSYKKLGDGVIVGPNAKISPAAVIEGKAIIGSGVELRPGAYLRGNVIIGPDCVIGNSSELKNCILLRRAQVPHYNYVGDSILGNGAHMGAGAICSNLKSDGRPVVIHGDADYETGMRKVGAILGDFADIGCGCVLNPGTVIGKKTSVYPLTSVRGVIPGGAIMKSPAEIILRGAR